MDTEIDLNYVKRITYFERVYADIRRAHGQDHTKGSGKSNDVALNGLTDALNGWESMKVISEREAAWKSSLVGGQGKGDVTCKCKGSCNTNACSCFKAGRICCLACHRNNFKCCNNDRKKSIKT